MSMTDRYAKAMVFLKDDIEVVQDYTHTDFPGNPGATCAARVLRWCASFSKSFPKEKTGLSESLLSAAERIQAIQYGPLENGEAFQDIQGVKDTDLRGKNSAQTLAKATPWSGEYKCYVIASNKGDAHMLGAYFPWFGDCLFYDPNLVVGRIKKGGSIYRVLQAWPDIYLGCCGNKKITDAQWGFETLYIVPDPVKAWISLK